MLQAVGGHHAQEVAHFLHLYRLAFPVAATHDARCRHVARLEPDVDAAVGSVPLAAGREAGLREECLAQRFEMPPVDLLEHAGVPRGLARGGHAFLAIFRPLGVDGDRVHEHRLDLGHSAVCTPHAKGGEYRGPRHAELGIFRVGGILNIL